MRGQEQGEENRSPNEQACYPRECDRAVIGARTWLQICIGDSSCGKASKAPDPVEIAQTIAEQIAQVDNSQEKLVVLLVKSISGCLLRLLVPS